MENIGWILLILIVGIIFLYKRLSNNPKALTSRYTVIKVINFARVDAVHNIITALKNAKFKNVEYDPEENIYYAQSNLSFWSWTEFIEIRSYDKDGQLKIEFTSTCALPTQIYAWEKNKRNAKRFMKKLEQLK